jgi:hypothetical protein
MRRRQKRIAYAKFNPRPPRRNSAAQRELRESLPTFTLPIEGKPGTAGIHALRAILKTLLRRHGFRCLDAWEEGQP